MELKATLTVTGVSPSVYLDVPVEEFSDDDDDRNHKHRRIEAQSQSSDRGVFGQVVTVPFKTLDKPLETVGLSQENKFQVSEPWEDINTTFLERDFPVKFEKRDTGLGVGCRFSLDSSQIRVNILGDPGSWTQPDSGFPSANIVAHVGQQGSFPFPGIALPYLTNPRIASLSSYRLASVRPDRGLDKLPSGQGTLMAPANSALSFSFPHQRCRDFEEQGYCLRGDLCPMEHDVNRIVVQDVQSLSQFNLPVSISSAHLLRRPTVPGPPPLSNIVPRTSMDNEELHNGSAQGIISDGIVWKSAYPASTEVGGTDLYDPDQLLWTSNDPETQSSLLRGTADIDTQDQRPEPSGFSHNTSLSVLDRVGSSRNNVEDRNKLDTMGFLEYPGRETKENKDSRSEAIEISPKTRNGVMSFARKSTQKADRTLFVKGIPQQVNKIGSLLSHFQKFGEVIDIHITPNSERAFIQFSKREEAEAALKAPDAVMGNRFIKLMWANRDSIPDGGKTGGCCSSYSNSDGPKTSSLPSHTKSVSSSWKNKSQDAAAKAKDVQRSDSCPLPCDKLKPLDPNAAKVPPPSQKKLPTLEQLKEELRQKHKMLDEKRKDFKRQLEKLEKRQKVVPAPRLVNVQSSRSSDTGSPCAKSMENTRILAANGMPHVPRAAALEGLKESNSWKQPSSPLGASFLVNRHKLDDRPTAFKIIPPLPSSLGSVAALKEHFSPYGDLATVELENIEGNDDSDGSQSLKHCSALIRFTMCQSAEKAFANGKCWKGHFLQFLWVKPDECPTENHVGKQQSPPASTKPCTSPQEPVFSETRDLEFLDRN